MSIIAATFNRLITLITPKKFEPRPGVWIVPKGSGNFTYHDGNLVVEISGELVTGPINYVIYASSIDFWLEPTQHAEISPNARDIILSDLGKYLDHVHATYVID